MGWGAKTCPATDLTVETVGGICPLCGHPASKHRRERVPGDDENPKLSSEVVDAANGGIKK